MRILRRIVPLVCVALLACSGTETVAPRPAQQAAPQPAPTLRVIASPDTIHVGQEMSVVVLATTGGTTSQPMSGVTWTLSGGALTWVQNDSRGFARVKAVVAGVSVVTVSYGGNSAQATITVLPIPDPSGAALVIDSFSMIEYQYPGDPTWYYAPQVQIREVNGKGAAAITMVDFQIPGLLPAPPCNTYTPVAPLELLNVFQESYGDFAFAIYAAGVRATGDTATVSVLYADGTSPVRSITARGPIRGGSLPTTYSGGSSRVRCM